MNAPHESEYYYKEIVDQLSEILGQTRGESILRTARKLMKKLKRHKPKVSRPAHRKGI